MRCAFMGLVAIIFAVKAVVMVAASVPETKAERLEKCVQNTGYTDAECDSCYKVVYNKN